MDQEGEFNRLLDELNNLIIERDAALSSLAQVDQHLSSLSTAIGLTSNGLNTPAGLLCMLRPVSRLADVLGGGGSSGANYLFELILRNNSVLSLVGNWNMLVARLKPQESSIVHVASLPQIAAGAAWSTTLALDLSTTSSTEIDLAVFLCFNGADTSTITTTSNIALLHVFRLDALHALQTNYTTTDGGRSGGNITLHSDKNIYSRKSTYSSTSQAMEVKVGVPKQYFGIEPEPQGVLDVLLQQGERSMNLPLAQQISISTGKNTKSSASNGSMGVTRRQQKAVIQGELPETFSTTTAAATTTTTNKNSSIDGDATLSIQPAPFSLAAASSPHAVLDVTCEAGNIGNCLKMHKAVLKRVQQLESAVRENSGADSGGIQLSHGVLVPSACSFGALLDSNELEETSSRLTSLKEAAVRLQEMIAAAEAGEGPSIEEEKIAAELLDLLKNIRNQTKNLVLTL
jgi:hypothetical protein